MNFSRLAVYESEEANGPTVKFEDKVHIYIGDPLGVWWRGLDEGDDGCGVSFWVGFWDGFGDEVDSFMFTETDDGLLMDFL